VRRLLLTGAGTGATNNLVRSFRRADPALSIVAFHSDRFVLKNSSADRNYLLPPSDHPDFPNMLRRLITVERVDLLVPANDPDVRTISAHRAGLPCRLFLPSHGLIKLCQDKYRLTKVLRARGLPAPASYLMRRLKDVNRAFRRLGPERPLWCRIRTGSSSMGAIPVNTPQQARSWIQLWTELRGVPPSAFTMSDYLPGREYGVQGLWKNGEPVIIKMCEILSYFGGFNQLSGMSSTPALAKMTYEPAVIELCERVIRAVEPQASGIFSIDLKEDRAGNPCVMEINAGRFCMITGFYDLTGQYNMAAVYLQIAFDESVDMVAGTDVAEDYYLVRDLDTLPAIFHGDELLEESRVVAALTERRRHGHDGRRRVETEGEAATDVRRVRVDHEGAKRVPSGTAPAPQEARLWRTARQHRYEGTDQTARAKVLTGRPPRPGLPDIVRLSSRLDRRALEVLRLEIRHLARRLGVQVKERASARAIEPSPAPGAGRSLSLDGPRPPTSARAPSRRERGRRGNGR
jgi:glutathione synthase/RimK-type ligase-like ATP-grasp enzyme